MDCRGGHAHALGGDVAKHERDNDDDDKSGGGGGALLGDSGGRSADSENVAPARALAVPQRRR